MMQYIEISKIYPHPDNPRKDLGDLTELAESIKIYGILQNITAVPWFSEITRAPADDGKMDGHYRVVIGHRRLAAAKLAGLEEVPCSIADMDQRAQIATMLTENIQRSDLTIYEQAQGFQMMLNFGDTVNDIAERTGFSETTVRRRVKLLALDREKFKKSVERGATLLDYAELDKICDAELKNSVLDKIGTPNFKWELQRAIDKEKSDKNTALIVAELEKFATQVDNSSGLRHVISYSGSRLPEIIAPNDANTVEYFFHVSGYGYVTLYKKQGQSEAGAAQDEKQKELQVRHASLQEISKRAYQLRRDFICDISNTQAKKSIGVIIEYSLRAMLDTYFDLDHDEFFEILNIEVKEDWNFDDIAEHVTALPERSLLFATYLALDSGREEYFNWRGEYQENEDLDCVYIFLKKLGYEMSDEERALQEGTHKLYFGEEEK